MRWDIRIEENGQQSYSSAENIVNAEQEMNPYAYCLPRYAKMDGTYINAPDMIPEAANGYISSSLSDADGVFRETPVITITFDRLKTSGGIHMVFNRVSGDYAKRLQIDWYKDEKLVGSEIFEPDNTDYFCRARVSLFNRMVITFLETNHPYRYLWIAGIRNQRMEDAGGLKIVYDDIALGAKEDNTAVTEDMRYYVNLENLKEEVEYPDYAMCLPRYAKMDGAYQNAPDELHDIGYVSDSISDGSGVFAIPPVLTFTMGQNYSSVGLTLRFNDYSGDYCSKVMIQWYRDEELLFEQEYEPDAYEFFCYGVVDYYNKIVITFLETSKPYRNVFLTGITWGLIRVFRDDELENVDCLMELSAISEEISINTLSYTVRSKTDYAFEFQKKQKQTLYFDEAVMGIFYLKDGKQLGARRYSVEAQDAVGILDSSQFMGGMYQEVAAREIFEEIMHGEKMESFLDDTLTEIKVSGYLPISSKREALQQLAFAIGAVVDTSYDRQLYLYPVQSEVDGQFTKKDIFLGLTIEHSEIVTGVRLYVHQYSEGTESCELYRGICQNEMKIEFSEPYHSLEISGGTLIESGVNYAYISGNAGEIVLTGKKYDHAIMTMLKEDPKVSQNKQIAEIDGATLVTASNAESVLERVYEKYRNNEKISFTGVITDQELGDRVQVDTGFKGKMEGVITKLDFRFSRKKITAEVTVE